MFMLILCFNFRSDFEYKHYVGTNFKSIKTHEFLIEEFSYRGVSHSSGGTVNKTINSLFPSRWNKT